MLGDGGRRMRTRPGVQLPAGRLAGADGVFGDDAAGRKVQDGNDVVACIHERVGAATPLRVKHQSVAGESMPAGVVLCMVAEASSVTAAHTYSGAWSRLIPRSYSPSSTSPNHRPLTWRADGTPRTPTCDRGQGIPFPPLVAWPPPATLLPRLAGERNLPSMRPQPPTTQLLLQLVPCACLWDNCQ